MKELFEKYGVIKTGHFKLTSGKHSNQYINKDAVYSNLVLFDNVVMKMHDKINSYRDTFDVITGPAVAGAILAAPIALILSKTFVYPEKVKKGLSENMVFRRGYDKILKHKRVWIIEDIITTGNSIEKTIMAIRDCGGRVAGISAIWNRGVWQPDENILFELLMDEYVSSYWPSECPQCQAGEILQDPKE
jgi:orotate phosphoribosyltransferase